MNRVGVILKRILMIAYHYPPMRGKSGTQRTLHFSRYLPQKGWEPLVLTVSRCACHDISDDPHNQVPINVPIYRAFAFDARRHFRLGKFYPRWLATPDRWANWWFSAVPLGLHLIRKYKPDIIWSTYPIATAHLIALSLHRSSKIPWVADFRDSMTEAGYPHDPAVRRAFRWIERQTMRHASRVIFTTQGALQMYAERYPQIPRSRWAVIQNGYDEETFSELEQSRTFLAGGNPCVLLHSGLLYRSERNPTAFFSALAKLRESGRIDPTAVNVVLRDSGDEDYYRKMLKDLNLEEIVLLRPGVPFRDAVAEMLVADGLLIFQASNCNHQIPAKVYEYFRAGRPIFAMTDPKGDTASLLRSSGIGIIVPLDNKERILDGLVHFLELVRQGRADMPPPHEFEKHSRRQRTKELSALLDSLAV